LIPEALSSPDRISGELRQKAAVSVSKKSRTTIQSSFARALRWKRAFCPPTAGFCPINRNPLIFPAAMSMNIGMWEWSPVILGW